MSKNLEKKFFRTTLATLATISGYLGEYSRQVSRMYLFVFVPFESKDIFFASHTVLYCSIQKCNSQKKETLNFVSIPGAKAAVRA
jgi:hypothetical protein